MGTSIYLLTEVYKDNRWHLVERPEHLVNAGYREFAVLAGVRDSFNLKLFEPKGLPDDLSSSKAYFKSVTDHARRIYETGSLDRLVLTGPDGSVTYADAYVPELEIPITEDEYVEMQKNNPDPHRYYGFSKSWTRDKGYQHFVHDASLKNAIFDAVPNKKLFATFEDYLNAFYKDDWCEEQQDYGSYDIKLVPDELDACSYLTLEELLSADLTKYNSVSYKLDKEFYEKFLASGGILPPCFTVSESGIGSIVDAMHEAIEPTVTVSWPKSEEKAAQLDLNQGIKELKEIAEKHNVKNNEIRIVFGFD